MVTEFAELYSTLFRYLFKYPFRSRCCGFTKPPTIEIVNVNDEIYLNYNNYQERMQDIKYYNHYCFNRAKKLSIYLYVYL